MNSLGHHVYTNKDSFSTLQMLKQTLTHTKFFNIKIIQNVKFALGIKHRIERKVSQSIF